MNLDKIIQSRRSIRKFKNKKPDWRDIIECIDAARYAPMAGGSFSLKFILVSDPEKIEQLAECTQQQFVKTAQYVVVFLSVPTRTINAYGKQGEIYVRQQAGAAIQNFLLKIVEKGLSTTWVGYCVEDAVKRTLKIPEEAQIEAMFPIGYAAEKPRRREYIDFDSCLYFEEYKNKKMKNIKTITSA